jgi:hypothetical protein
MSAPVPFPQVESEAASKPFRLVDERPDVPGLAAAILHTVAYADVFDFPLTPQEVCRSLIGVLATQDEVDDVLRHDTWLAQMLVREEGYVMLRGRESLLETRRRRARASAGLWPLAVKYGRAIGRLPFVRMVTLTGALAYANAEVEGDIDYLIVTAPGRLWLCRAAVIAVVRWAARRGTRLCPNYFLTERALRLRDRSLYTAHELLHMVPLSGIATYRAMRETNTWAAAYLPNAARLSPHTLAADEPPSLPRRLAEAALATPPAAQLEGWEMRRKMRKFSARPGAEADFGPDWCKGHFDGHGEAALTTYAARLHALEAKLP